MKKRQRALISIIAIFGLLAVISAAWLKPAAAVASELRPVSKIHHVHAGAVSNFRMRADVKPRNPVLQGSLGGAIKALVFSFEPRHSLADFNDQAISATTTVRPLWLINRALLI